MATTHLRKFGQFSIKGFKFSQNILLLWFREDSSISGSRLHIDSHFWTCSCVHQVISMTESCWFLIQCGPGNLKIRYNLRLCPLHTEISPDSTESFHFMKILGTVDGEKFLYRLVNLCPFLIGGNSASLRLFFNTKPCYWPVANITSR